MYLKLSVAGHLTIFLTRTRGPFWSIRPARILWMAVLGTQMVATLIAVYGLFMTPLGWRWAGFVWGYAIAWFLVADRVKLLAYRILDPAKAAHTVGIKAEAKPETETKPQPGVQVMSRPDSKVTPQPDAKATVRPKITVTHEPEAGIETPFDPTPQLVKRVHQLYEELGREDVRAVQDWDAAERKVSKEEPEK
jgi:H+-transporting ATPase